MASNQDSKTKVYIIGPLRVQNELFSSFLKKSTGLEYKYYPKIALIPSFDTHEGQSYLVLLDCFANNSSNLLASLAAISQPRIDSVLIALFNLHPHEREKIEKEAFRRGVRGVFSMNESLDLLSKGIQAIINGELWFSRQTMSKCLMDSQHTLRQPNETEPAITRREREILYMIVSGRTNSEIANELYISPHTVKTHIYNLYRKIEVPNRLTAALWAAKQQGLSIGSSPAGKTEEGQ